MEFRVGLGSDRHRLIEGRPLILGGVTIPFPLGADAHSDGDALSHALIDALLGAAALGDIGELFPPEDPQWKNAVSIELLRTVYDKVQQAGWELVNVDAVIECEAPKLLPYRSAIRESLAGALHTDAARVFVKGKTAEGLDAVGSGRAIAASAVCLIKNGRKHLGGF